MASLDCLAALSMVRKELPHENAACLNFLVVHEPLSILYGKSSSKAYVYPQSASPMMIHNGPCANDGI